MIYSTPSIFQINSTTANLSLATANPLCFVSFKFVIYNPKVNNTVNILDINGQSAGSFTISQSMELECKYSDYSQISFSDSNNYQIYGWIQRIYPENAADIKTLETETDITLVPIGNVIITSPLDGSTGYLQVIGNVIISSPLDGSTGYLEVIQKSPLPAGTNLLGKMDIDQTIQGTTNGVVATHIISLLSSSPYIAPANGTYIFQLSGTGVIATLTLAGNTDNLNGGFALVAGALYEFQYHGLSGDSITIASATVQRVMFITGD